MITASFRNISSFTVAPNMYTVHGRYVYLHNTYYILTITLKRIAGDDLRWLSISAQSGIINMVVHNTPPGMLHNNLLISTACPPRINFMLSMYALLNAINFYHILYSTSTRPISLGYTKSEHNQCIVRYRKEESFSNVPTTPSKRYERTG
jgi:hypothetical protein